MATFREMVYMVLDLLKERSDDAYYTEEHVLFLLSKIRALLLEKKYRGARNAAYSPMSAENMQTVCLDLVPSSGFTGCDGKWLKSTIAIPNIITDIPPAVHTVNDLLPTAVTFVTPERMPYVGHNRWLRNIIYCSRSIDGYLYLHSVNPQFMHLEKVIMNGVFANPEEAAKLVCEKADGGCDILDESFPLEEPLISQCIELAVQEISGSRYVPEDKNNDGRDGLGDVGTATATQKQAAAKNDDGK